MDRVLGGFLLLLPVPISGGPQRIKRCSFVLEVVRESRRFPCRKKLRVLLQNLFRWSFSIRHDCLRIPSQAEAEEWVYQFPCTIAAVYSPNPNRKASHDYSISHRPGRIWIAIPNWPFSNSSTRTTLPATERFIGLPGWKSLVT